MPNWYCYSDPRMEEALYETTILRQLAGLSLHSILDESTILNFRRLLERHELTAGMLSLINGYNPCFGQDPFVTTTLIHAPSSTKNQDGKRDPETHRTKKDNRAQAHIGAHERSRLAHRVEVTSANVVDFTQLGKLRHREENEVYGYAGYTGIEKSPEREGRQVICQIAARRSNYLKHRKRSTLYKAIGKIQRAKAQVLAKAEHTFRVIKHQIDYIMVRFHALTKNIAKMAILFALSSLWMARRYLLTNAEEARL